MHNAVHSRPVCCARAHRRSQQQRRALRVEAHHGVHRHHHSHSKGSRRGDKATPPGEGEHSSWWGSAIHRAESGVFLAAQRVQHVAAAAELPPLLPPSLQALRTDLPVYGAYAGVLSLLFFAVRSAVAALWLRFFKPAPQSALLQDADSAAVVEPREDTGAVKPEAAAASSVVTPEAEATDALRRLAMRERSFTYARQLWAVTTLLVLFASDLLNQALRP